MRKLVLGTPTTSVSNWSELVEVFFPNKYVVERLDKGHMPHIDMLIFDGGADVNPHLYGQEKHPATNFNNRRDMLECNIFHKYFGVVPIAGICRGHQFINVMMGGTLHQDLPSINKRHTLYHDIEWVNTKPFWPWDTRLVNSYHHQAVDIVGENMNVLARHNGIIEATEDMDNMVRSVQWHPEYYSMPSLDIYTMEHLFFRDFFGPED